MQKIQRGLIIAAGVALLIAMKIVFIWVKMDVMRSLL